MNIRTVAAGSYIPKSTDVRYFNKEHQIIAAQIVEQLQQNGLANARASFLKNYEGRSQNIEIWLRRVK